jgi:uncharacterized protein
MVVEIRKQVCDGLMLKWLLAAGMEWLVYNQDQVNHMNVFPVPDGDTGTNMRLTMETAHDAVAQLHERHVGIMAQQAAQGALRGARGNSGVILSQLLHGFAVALRGHEVFDAPLLVTACQSAVSTAYNAVMEPVEGTMLTVARQTTEALAGYAEDNEDLVGALNVMVEASREALKATPDLLPVLKRAGVVDSGGQGLVFLLEGMKRVVDGETLDLEGRLSFQDDIQGWEAALEPDDIDGYGYDVQFLMMGEALAVDEIRAAIDAMGWSTLVVGDEKLVKVHVHVHDPGQPLSYAISTGAMIDDIVVENMQAQYETYTRQRQEREAPGPDIRQVEGAAAVVVASGAGMRELFYEGLGAAMVIAGGQTMNPSTQDFLDAIERLESKEILLLPNNRNVLLAAQQAVSMTEGKQVRVIPTTTLPQGISAMLAYLDLREGGGLDEIADGMREAAGYVITCEVTLANRDAHFDQISVRRGAYIGLLDDELVSSGDELDEVVHDLLRKAGTEQHELVTVYYGEDITEDQAAALIETLRAAFPGQHFEPVNGGQPLYPYVFSVE